MNEPRSEYERGYWAAKDEEREHRMAMQMQITQLEAKKRPWWRDRRGWQALAGRISRLERGLSVELVRLKAERDYLSDECDQWQRKVAELWNEIGELKEENTQLKERLAAADSAWGVT